MHRIIIATLVASVAVIGHANAEKADSGQETRGERGAMRAQMVERMQELGLDGFTEHMRERAGERFDSMDADSDGVVTRDEFLAATGERAETMFERMEPNEDGVVTRTGRERGGMGRHHRGPRGEGRGGMRGMDAEERAERMSERAAEQFARLDTDGDQMVSLEEFEAGMQARIERSSERRQGRAERMEQRGEGRGEGRHGGMRGEMRAMHGQIREMMREGMNLDDFSSLMQERAGARFDGLDADEDGEITREEFLASVDDRAERAFSRMERMESGERPGRGGWHGGRHHRGDRPAE
ncbi:MAG: hypothetical protein MEQ84_02160 [Mesorhizobium sp.]|nr:hypothetical protein [Mesorhizobium sp.]